MDLWGLELGTWAEWIASLAAIVGTLLSIYALRMAREANRTAELTRREAHEAAQASESREAERDRTAAEQRRKIDEKEVARDRRESDRLLREHEREQRQLAGSVQAWWVTGGREQWGLMVSNEIGACSVFHDVEIKVAGNQFSSQVMIETLPPGRFFVKSGTAGSPWALPEPASDAVSWSPIMRSTKHLVSAISFTDPLGKRWSWTPEEGLSSKG